MTITTRRAIAVLTPLLLLSIWLTPCCWRWLAVALFGVWLLAVCCWHGFEPRSRSAYLVFLAAMLSMPFVYLGLKILQDIFTPPGSGLTESAADAFNRRTSNYSFWFFLATLIATFHFCAATARSSATFVAETLAQKVRHLRRVQMSAFVGAGVWLIAFYLYEIWETHGTFWSDDGIVKHNSPVDAVQCVEGAFNMFMLCGWAYGHALCLDVIERVRALRAAGVSVVQRSKRDLVAERVVNGALSLWRLIALFVVISVASIGFLKITGILPTVMEHVKDTTRGVLGAEVMVTQQSPCETLAAAAPAVTKPVTEALRKAQVAAGVKHVFGRLIIYSVPSALLLLWARCRWLDLIYLTVTFKPSGGLFWVHCKYGPPGAADDAEISEDDRGDHAAADADVQGKEDNHEDEASGENVNREGGAG